VSQRSIESFVSQHYAFVWRIVRGLGLTPSDAEDAAQQVLMIATRKLDGIAEDRERSFLYGVAVRVANNARRSVRRRREVPEDDSDTAPSSDQSPEQRSELTNARALLHDLMGQMPEKLRRVLLLAEVEELELRAIADLEGIPHGTAASRLRLARERFKKLLLAENHRNPYAREA